MSRILALVGVLALTACPAPTPADPIDSGDPDTTPVQADPPQVDGDDLGDVDVRPEDQAPSRSLKRMTVGQVRDSMEQISGGIRWRFGRRNESNWDRFADTLGVPDYQERTDEDLEPSVLFQKFLDDAASATCTEWVDRAVSGRDDSFFAEGSLPDAAGVDASVRHLRRKVQGIALDAEPDQVAAYRELYDLVITRTDDPEAAWRTVCVALFTHPDFYAY